MNPIIKALQHHANFTGRALCKRKCRELSDAPKGQIQCSPGQRPGYPRKTTQALKGRPKAGMVGTPFQGLLTLSSYPGRCPGLALDCPSGASERLPSLPFAPGRARRRGKALVGLLSALALSASLAAKDAHVAQALQDAETLSNVVSLDATVPLEQYGYLIPKKGIVFDGEKNSSIDSKTIILVQPGSRSYTVRYGENRHTPAPVGPAGPSVPIGGGFSVGISLVSSLASGHMVYSDPVNVSAVFQPGKFYTIDYKEHSKLTKIELEASIVEVTTGPALEDAKRMLEKMRAYRASIQASAGALDGAYTAKGGRTIIIAGNKFFLSTSSFRLPYLFKGTLGYDNETMILRADFIKVAKTASAPSKGSGYVYYKLHDGILDIIDQSGNLGASAKGQFKRSPLTNADRARLLANLDINTPDDAKGDMFTLNYPEANWGPLCASVGVPPAYPLAQLKQDVLDAMKTYKWTIECSNDTLVIGSYMRSKVKYPAYVKFDGKQVDIYVNAGDASRGWTANLRKAIDKKLNPVQK